MVKMKSKQINNFGGTTTGISYAADGKLSRGASHDISHYPIIFT